MDFDDLLDRAGITKAECARRLGLGQNTVYGWKNSAPEYVNAYLKLLIEYNRLRP